MPAYHSQYNEGDYNQLGNMSLLPLNTNVRGPAPPTDTSDIIDEAIELFRANCLFKNYEIKGGADRVLIYVTLFISEILTTLQTASNKSAGEATKILNNLALERFTIPGDPNFPLNSMYHPPENRNEADLLRQYVGQLRQETVLRMHKNLYPEGGSLPSKWWMMFAKRKFMGKSL